MRPCILAGLFIGITTGALQAQAVSPRPYAIGIDLAVAGAPLGDAANAFGTRAIPGSQYGIVLSAISESGDVWSVRVMNERFHVNPSDAETHFRYSSTSLAGRRSWQSRSGKVPVRAGAEAGWRHYRAASTIANYYTTELEESELSSNAGFVGLFYGVHFRSGATALTPQVRVEASYPDFGGGNGRSRLHAQSSVGFRASIGLELQLVTFGVRK